MTAEVQVRDVSYIYKGAKTAVMEDISFTIGAGEFFVLLGPSGCGKTTILNQVAGFERCTAGEISVEGRAVTGPGPDRAVVFQGDDSLLGWLNVRQNVEFPLKIQGFSKDEREARVAKALQLVELGGHERKYPHELSGGMKQRVQIARGLSTDADVLLMDEPFGALDAQTRTSLQNELGSIWMRERRTVLFITHDITEALLLADRVGIMSSGPSAYLHEILEVDMPRPRERNAAFQEKYELLERLLLEAKERTRAGGEPKEGASA